MMSEGSKKAFQICINPDCRTQYDCAETVFKCSRCDSLLDVAYNWDSIDVPGKLSDFAKSQRTADSPLDFSGVWRFGKLLDFCDDKYKVTIGEGQTILERNDTLAEHLGMKRNCLYLQYEGLNPSGSFKDNGMAAAFSHASMVGAKSCACASTGNTSASTALYARRCGMDCIVFVGSGKIAFGKLSQAMDYGAKTIQIQGDFDDCMKLVQQLCRRLGIYIVNSINPFRLEGQKTIMYRVLEHLNWQIPDWIVVPGGNLGNSSAFGKAFDELKMLGLIERIPRLAIINAAGANTLTELYNEKKLCWNGGRVDKSLIDTYYAELDAKGFKPSTCASAIEISRPVNLLKCLRSLDICNGAVRMVTDEEILDAKALIGLHGLGCEPASAATIAGLKHLLADGAIGPDQQVVCILTGHPLKDPDAVVNYHKNLLGKFSNPPTEAANDIESVEQALISIGCI